MAQVVASERSTRKLHKTVDVDRLKALAERVIPDRADPRIVQRIEQFFTSDVSRYLQEITVFEDRFAGEALQDPELRGVFADAGDRVIAEGERVVADLDKQTTKRVKEAFREAIRPWTAGNPSIERFLKKPRGYAGDFAMMDMGYDNQPALTGGLAGVFDRYFLDHFECVRQRKDKLRETIRQYLYDPTRRGSPLQMLSLGSGPCREWVELDRQYRLTPTERAKLNRTRLTGIDKDPEALAYGRSRLEGNSLLSSVELAEQDLFQFTKAERWRSREQSYDLIYGLGIANYFYDATLENIIACAFTLVKPGGELMITHKDSRTFNFPVAEWVCDWVFLKRSAEEFSHLFEEALSPFGGQYAYRLEPVPNGEIFYGIAKRIAA